jgi:hypothetical protein
VDGNPPVKVADKLVALPTVIGEDAEVVIVTLCLLTASGSQLLVAGAYVVSPPYEAE